MTSAEYMALAQFRIWKATRISYYRQAFGWLTMTLLRIVDRLHRFDTSLGEEQEEALEEADYSIRQAESFKRIEERDKEDDDE